MTTTILSIIAIASVLFLGWLSFDTLADLAVADRNLAGRQQTINSLREQLAESERIRHEIAGSAMRGAPAVKWHRDLATGLPNGADMWYWRVRVAGADLLLTDEQFTGARTRAAKLLPTAVES